MLHLPHVLPFVCLHKKKTIQQKSQTPLCVHSSALCAALAADMEAVQKMALIGTDFAQTPRGPTS